MPVSTVYVVSARFTYLLYTFSKRLKGSFKRLQN